MTLPFVSRGRFEDAQARIAQLEAENRRLLAMLLPTSEEKPKAEPISLSEADLSKIQPVPGRATVATITADATKAAYGRLHTPEKRSLAEDLNRIEAPSRRQSVG